MHYPLLVSSDSKLHWDFSELAEGVFDQLQQVLEIIKSSDNARLYFALDQQVIDLLVDEYADTLAELKSLYTRDQIHFILRPPYSPLAPLTSAEQLSRQILGYRDYIHSLGLKSKDILLIDSGVSHLLEEDLIKNFEGIVITSNSPDSRESNFVTSTRSIAIQKSDRPLSCHDLTTGKEITLARLTQENFPDNLRNIFAVANSATAFSKPKENQLPDSPFYLRFHNNYQRVVGRLSKTLAKVALGVTSEKQALKLATAERNIAKASSQELWDIKSQDNPKARLSLYRSLIQAEVEIDALDHPDVDPAEGWIKLEEFNELNPRRYSIDTQLFRLEFSLKNHATLDQCLYKPRKIDLLNTLVNGQLQRSFSTSLHDHSLEQLKSDTSNDDDNKFTKVDYLKTRHTPGLVGLRFIKQLDSKSPLKLVEDYTIKSGIGAFANNSTTGWTFEHWIEGEVYGDKLLRVEFNLLLPTPISYTNSARLLLVAGGEAEHANFLTSKILHTSNEVAGGIYGVRLIDGITNFTIDFRSSKKVAAIVIDPILTGELLQSIRLYFFYPAKDLIEDHNSNSIFVSIP